MLVAAGASDGAIPVLAYEIVDGTFCGLVPTLWGSLEYDRCGERVLVEEVR